MLQVLHELWDFVSLFRYTCLFILPHSLSPYYLDNFFHKLSIKQPKPHTIKQLQPHTIKQLQPHTIKQLQLHTIKQLQPHTIKQLQPHTIKQLQPHTIKQLQLHTIKQLQPHTIKQLQPLYRIQSLITFTNFIIINIPSGDVRLCENILHESFT